MDDILVLREHLLNKLTYYSIVNLLIQNMFNAFSVFFFSLLFLSFVRSTCLDFQTNKISYNQQKGVSDFVKHRAASPLYPHRFSLMLSYTSVANILPPKLQSPVGITPNRYPFHRLRFLTFLL